MDGAKIINKNGVELCQDCKPLPGVGGEGTIVQRNMDNSRLVLIAEDPTEGAKVIFDSKIPWDEMNNVTKPGHKTSYWHRSRMDEKGYFYIVNDNSQKKLYAIENNHFTNGPLPDGNHTAYLL